MGNFAENLNLGNRVRPPPATENLHTLQRQRGVLGSQRRNLSSFE